MSLTERLTKNLDDKISLLSRLESVLRDERTVIVALDLSAMEEADAKKREIIQELERNKEESLCLLRQGGEAAGLGPDITLSALVATLPPADQKTLRPLQSRALKEGEKVDREIAVNRELLVSSLRTVNASLDFIHRMFTLGTTYGEGGKIAEESGVRLVSREA